MPRVCEQCGGRPRRIHRTFLQRFAFLAIYECGECGNVVRIARRHRYYFGRICRCPKCGTSRLSRLKERDQIDPMDTGIRNYFERIAGGSLYHCRFCRIQFYDRRKMASDPKKP